MTLFSGSDPGWRAPCPASRSAAAMAIACSSPLTGGLGKLNGCGRGRIFFRLAGSRSSSYNKANTRAVSKDAEAEPVDCRLHAWSLIIEHHHLVKPIPASSSSRFLFCDSSFSFFLSRACFGPPNHHHLARFNTSPAQQTGSSLRGNCRQIASPSPIKSAGCRTSVEHGRPPR